MARTVNFPAMKAPEEAKLRNLLIKIGELMGDEFTTESAFVVQVSVPDDRADMLSVVNKIRSGMERPKAVKSNKPAQPTPAPPSAGS